MQINIKTGNPNEKGLYKHLIIEEIQMVYKHMKKGSILLVVGKLPIKTTIRCYYTPNRLSSILKCDGTVKGVHL